MDAEILQGFVEQAESSLPKIRGGILVCVREGNIYGALDSAIRELGSIRNAASVMGFEEVEKSAARLEEKIKPFAAAKEKLADEKSRQFLDELAGLESLIAKINFSLDDFSLDIADFVDDYFENIQNRETLLTIVEEEEAVVVEESEDEFEIDEEMLEIFAVEAEELVQNINTNLQILGGSRNDREALLEVRRSAHTLKGSAGIVGLKKLSQVAHRVEDLLDYLAENDIDADDRVFELLLSATDCFEVLATGESSHQLNDKVTQIYKSCDEILASLKKKNEQIPAFSVSVSEPKPLTAQSPEAEIKEGQTQISPAQNRSIVRVSLDKLDDLVRCVSDLVVSRSVFEQRLTELERQTEELRHITHRLQFSTNKLEIDFETDLLDAQSQSQISNSFSEIGSWNQEIGHSQLAVGNPQSFDSLEFDHYTEFHQTTRELLETAADNSAVHSDLTLLKSNFEMLFDSQRRLIDEMQDKLLHLRMVSFDLLSVRLRRTVRVTCDEEDKQAELFIEGENLEIDTQILDSLVEPLLHLLRNAVAHGIELPETRRMVGKPETGKISVRVYSDGTHLVLNVTDDGRGISAAALKEKAVQNSIISREAAEAMTEEEAFSLIFLPGLTTAEKLSQVSGRGVGMNIVKAGIVRRQGTISIHSEAQKGTTFTVRLPLPLAITLALPVKSGKQIFAFPLKLIKEATEIPAANLQEIVQIGEENYKVLYLNNLLGLPTSSRAKNSDIPVLLIETAENFYALIVDRILKPEEIVIKRLGLPLQNFAQMLGAATLGNGNVIPVLDLHYLLEQKAQSSKSKVQSPSEIQPSLPENQSKIQNPKSQIPKVLIVDDSPSVRHLTSKVIKNAGMNAVIAKDGLEALEILQNSAELPDAILTDVEMPRMDGYELLASLKKQATLRDIPVIMITSRAGEKHRRKAFDLGVSEYLTKPFEDSVLLGKIKFLAKIA
jgi:chemosensory pili system protein ChpA (sensor histidine kinase/response regulator)